MRPQTCRSREEPVPPRKRKRAAGAGDGLLERERELDALEARLEAAREGRGGLVVVEGAAGIGKSRLLDAARGLAEPAGFRALSGKATELEHDFPFGYARQLFEDAVRAATPKQREALFAGAARHAEAVFSAEADDRAEPDGGHRVLHGLYWLLVNLSQDGPLLVAADDAHWSDPPSLRFLIYLASRLDGLPVLVVLASRPGEPGAEETLLDELLAARDAERLRPDALSREAVTSLIAARLGDPDPGFAEACWDATKGNPFLLAELTREVADEEIAPDDAGAERIRVLGPQTISRTVLVRIARLGDVEVKVAEAVAVIGDATRVGQAARFAEISERDAARAADDLVRIGILRPDRRLSFAHPVVRTAIYQDLAPRERAALHRKAADILAEDGAPAGKVAGHLLFTDPGGDAEVVEVLRSAARSALSRGAPEAAIPLLRRALEEPPPDAERVPVLRELGRAETRAGDPRAGERLGQAMELAPDPLVRAEVARELSTAIVHAGRQAEAVELLDRTADAVRADDPELARHLEAELLFLATLDEALYRAQRARFGSLEEIGGDSPGERALLAVLAYRSMLEGEPADRTISLAQRAMGDGRLLEEAAPDSPLFWLVAASLVLAGADELAEPMIEAGVTDAESRGSLIGSALAYRVRAMLRLARGEVANAEVDSRASLEAARIAQWPERASVMHPLVGALVERGELGEATRLMAEERFDGRLPEHLLTTRLLEARGRLHHAAGRPREAIADLAELGERSERLPIGYTRWRPLAALAHHAVGEERQAKELAKAGVEAARAFGAPAELGVALRAAGVVDGGKRGLGELEESVATLAETGARLELARSLVDLGAALRRANQRSAGRDRLQEGFELARACGANALRDQASEELETLGSRPRSEVRSGVEELTPSELRVARMAAEGMANKDIAQSLFVTLKTVEVHLSSVYRKLDIGSRRELPEALRVEP